MSFTTTFVDEYPSSPFEEERYYESYWFCSMHNQAYTIIYGKPTDDIIHRAPKKNICKEHFETSENCRCIHIGYTIVAGVWDPEEDDDSEIILKSTISEYPIGDWSFKKYTHENVRDDSYFVEIFGSEFSKE